MASSNARAEVWGPGAGARHVFRARAHKWKRGVYGLISNISNPPPEGRYTGAGNPFTSANEAAVGLAGKRPHNRIACRSPGGPLASAFEVLPRGRAARKSGDVSDQALGVAPTALADGGFSTRVDIAVDNRGVGNGHSSGR
jgi:hypothetical protein